MSIPDILDVCYLMIQEDLKARLTTDRQICGFAQVMGAENVELPDIDKELADFSRWLESPPPELEPPTERQILLRALGLRG